MKSILNFVFGEVPPKKKKSEKLQKETSPVGFQAEDSNHMLEGAKEGSPEEMPIHPQFNAQQIPFRRREADTERPRRLRNDLKYLSPGAQTLREAEYPVYELDDLKGAERRDYIERMIRRFGNERGYKGLAGEERYDLLWILSKYGLGKAPKKILEALLQAKTESPQTIRDETDLKKEVQTLIKAGRVRNAMYLGELIDRGKGDGNFAERKEAETSALVKGRWPKSPEFEKYFDSEQRNMTRDLPLLYSYSLALDTVENVRRQQKMGKITLESEHLLLLARLEERIRNFVNTMFSFVRSYLVSAVLSEIRFAYDNTEGDGGAPRVIGYSHGRDYTSKETVRELLPDTEAVMNMLAGARYVFPLEKAFSPGFGGKPWEQIAALAYDMFAVPENTSIAEKIHLIDRAAQLEHNSGTVFNKDPSRVDAGYWLKPLLDLKRSAPHLSPQRLQKFLVEQAHESPVERLDLLDNELERLRKTLKARGADPIPSLDGFQQAA